MFAVTKELMLLDLEVETAEDVIRSLCSRLEECGHISAQHVHAVLQRELQYPTGLPTKPFAVAIPHGEAEGVNQSAIAFARLKQGVIFKNMVNSAEGLDVKLVFLLANRDPETQVSALRKLSEVFSEPDILEELYKVASEEEVAMKLSEIIRS